MKKGNYIKIIFKKMFKPRKGVMAAAIIAFVILLGGLQLYTAKISSHSDGFITQQVEISGNDQGTNSSGLSAVGVNRNNLVHGTIN